MKDWKLVGVTLAAGLLVFALWGLGYLAGVKDGKTATIDALTRIVPPDVTSPVDPKEHLALQARAIELEVRLAAAEVVIESCARLAESCRELLEDRKAELGLSKTKEVY